MSDTHDLDTLRMAFAYHVVLKVVAADGVVGDKEQAFVDSHLPQRHLVERGLLDAGGALTPTFHAARDAAIAQLSTLLDQDQKLTLIDTFLQASLSDGHLHHNESAAVLQAAQLLQLPGSVWLQHLERQGLVGDVDLPEPDGVEGFLQLLPDDEAETFTPADATTQTPGDAT